jgi:hypothetical protein
VGILDWPLKDPRQPWFGKRIRRDFSLKIASATGVLYIDEKRRIDQSAIEN